MGRYKLRMPTSVFVKRLRNDWTPEISGENFLRKSLFLNRLYTEKEWAYAKENNIRYSDYKENIID